MMKRNRAWIFVAAVTLICVLPLWWSLWKSASRVANEKKAVVVVAETPTTQVPFSPPNGGRVIRSLSLHPNGTDWLFVECAQDGDNRCDVMRYQRDSGRLYRYALPQAYSYTYARYSPQGNFIVMSRRPVHGESEDALDRSLNDSEIVLMRQDGRGLEVIPIAPATKLWPFMSLDETRIAFWRVARLVPPGKRIRLFDFDIWEFDRHDTTERPFSSVFHFVDGGRAQYISDDEILFESYGPIDHFSEYRHRYDGNEIYRMRRGVDKAPTPEVFDGIEHIRMPSMDRVGSLYLWGQTPRYGLTVIRIAADGQRSGWLQEGESDASFDPREVVCDPNGKYIASIYQDHPLRFGGGAGGLATLDIAANKWVTLPLPQWREAEEIPVPVSKESDAAS